MDLVLDKHKYLICKMPPDNDSRSTEKVEKMFTLGEARRYCSDESVKDSSLLIYLLLVREDSNQFVMAYKNGREYNANGTLSHRYPNA